MVSVPYNVIESEKLSQFVSNFCHLSTLWLHCEQDCRREQSIAQIQIPLKDILSNVLSHST